MNSKVTYHQQVSYCGKPRCRKCREGTGHGPYWYAYQTVEGRTTRTYVGKHLPPDVQAEIVGVQEPATPQAVEREQSTIRIYVLGQFRLERRDPHDPLDWQTVTDASWQHQRVRALLGCLVSVGNRKLGREQIMEALWPDLDTETAGSRLDRAVYSLRQLFEPTRSRLAASTLLMTEREMLVLAEQPQIWIDADAFEHLLIQARASEDPGEKERLFKEAATLYGGDFLPEEQKNEWTRTRREALQRSWVGLLLELSDLYIERDALNNAIDPLDKLLSVDPTNEAAVQRLIRLLMQLGRRGEALRAYKRLHAVLQQEYHIAPLPETRALYEALRSGGDKLPQISSNGDGGKGTSSTSSAAREARGTTPNVNELSALQIGRAHQSALVGREQEVEHLRALVTTTEHAARFRLAAQKRSTVSTLDPQRRPQCVLLLGDVGIGKTRLAEEVSREAKKRGWAVAWSRVYAQEGSIPYRLWTEVMRKAMEQAAWQRQEITKRPLVFQPLSALLPEVHALLPQVSYAASLPPEQEQLRLWEAARELLTIISESTPLLIALDDLQWSDSSSCELLAYLARRVYGLPIVIVGTCRDNELGPNHPLRPLLTDLQRENAVECISLERLSDEQIVSLVSQVPHVPEPLVPQISTRAAGNPFFAEELARTVGTQPVSTSLLSNAADMLPDTITAVLDLRLARLSMPCQRLLSKAAVLGGSFEFSVICAMEANTPGSDEDVVLDLLEEALKSGMLTEEGTGTRITYHFWHPLLVNHLYEGLSAARRASLHRRAAEVLRRVYQNREEEGAAIITNHLVQGGADPQLIVRYAELAGDHSYSLSSYVDAEEHYRIALQYLESGPIQSAEEQKHPLYLLEILGECLNIQGKTEEARNLYERILKIRSQNRNSDLFTDPQYETQIDALLWIEIGKAWYNVGNNVQAQLCYQHSRQVLQEAGVTAGTVWAYLLYQESHIRWREGAYEAARFSALEALKLFEETIDPQKRLQDRQRGSTRIRRTLLGDPVDLGRTHVLLSNIEAVGGRCGDALPHLNKALATFEEYDRSREIAIVSCNLGDLYLRTAEYSQAQVVLRRALGLAERMGDIPMLYITNGNLGLLDMRIGNLVEAEEELQNAIALAERSHDPITISIIRAYLSVVLQEQGNLPDAESLVRQALVTGRSTHVAPCIGLALVSLGKLRLAQFRAMLSNQKNNDRTGKSRERVLQQARKTLLRAIAIEGTEAETKIEARLLFAQVLLLENATNSALDQASQALEEARQFELAWLMVYSQRTLGSIFAAQGLNEKADQYFEQAIRLFRRNGMRVEYARSLYSYGEVLVDRNDVSGKKLQSGLDYLREARQVFADCKAELDLQVVEHMLAKYE